MNYKLDNKSISSYGALPYISNGCIAISGIFDLPKRIGTTEYDWGTSIEVFADKEDIELDGRSLALSMLIKATDYKLKLHQLKSDCISCRKLWTEFGEFDIIQKDEITVEEYPESNFATVTVNFWQQKYILRELAIIPSQPGLFCLDGFNLQNDFGIFISKRNGFENIAKRIEINTTLPYTCTSYRQICDASLNCFMKGNNLQDLYLKMMQFHALCMSPGLHNLKAGNNSYRLYFKDGISVSVASDSLLEFELKFKIVA